MSVESAFDRAWAVVKMPLVPSSIEQRGEDYHAQFHDPVDDVLRPMRMAHRPVEGFDQKGLDYRSDILDDEGESIADAHYHDEDWYYHGGDEMDPMEHEVYDAEYIDRKGGPLQVGDLNVDEVYRRRGMAEALHDLAMLGPGRGLSSGAWQTRPAAAMWTKNIGNDVADMKPAPWTDDDELDQRVWGAWTPTVGDDR